MHDFWENLVQAIVLGGYGIFGLATTVAKSYFTIESIVSLRRSERGIYDTVEWTNILPHG